MIYSTYCPNTSNALLVFCFTTKWQKTKNVFAAKRHADFLFKFQVFSCNLAKLLKIPKNCFWEDVLGIQLNFRGWHVKTKTNTRRGTLENICEKWPFICLKFAGLLRLLLFLCCFIWCQFSVWTSYSFKQPEIFRQKYPDFSYFKVKDPRLPAFWLLKDLPEEFLENTYLLYTVS